MMLQRKVCNLKKINDSIEKFIPSLTIVSILLIDILFLAGLIKVFFKWDSTIIAGVIAFIGAIMGGYITYLGVNKTLEHRDRELFLSDATEKLMNMEILTDTYKPYLNMMFFYEYSTPKEHVNALILQEVKKFSQQLMDDKEKIYKSMEIDSVDIINFHRKTLRFYDVKKELTDDEALKCIEKIRDVCKVIDASENKLRQTYYKYKKKH